MTSDRKSIDRYAVERAMKAADLTMAEFAVLNAMLFYADHVGLGNCRPSIATLAKHCGGSESTVKRSLNTLKGKGWLWVTKHGTRTAPTVYQVRIPKAAAEADEDEPTDRGRVTMTPMLVHSDLQPTQYQLMAHHDPGVALTPAQKKRQRARRRSKGRPYVWSDEPASMVEPVAEWPTDTRTEPRPCPDWAEQPDAFEWTPAPVDPFELWELQMSDAQAAA